MLDLFCEENTLCTVRSYWSEQFIAGNKTEKSSDEPRTDQEHRPGDRADQAHRVKLTARSTSFGCFIFGEINFRFCLLLLCKASFQVLYYCHSITSVVVCAVDKNLLKRRSFVVYKLFHRLT